MFALNVGLLFWKIFWKPLEALKQSFVSWKPLEALKPEAIRSFGAVFFWKPFETLRSGSLLEALESVESFEVLSVGSLWELWKPHRFETS